LITGAGDGFQNTGGRVRMPLVSTREIAMPQTADLTGDTGVGYSPSQPVATSNQPLDFEDVERNQTHAPRWNLVFSEEFKEAIADDAWINDQFNAGALEAYSGEYIGVVGKKILGHNRDLDRLRDEVSKASGIRKGRIVTFFVDPILDM